MLICKKRHAEFANFWCRLLTSLVQWSKPWMVECTAWRSCQFHSSSVFEIMVVYPRSGVEVVRSSTVSLGSTHDKCCQKLVAVMTWVQQLRTVYDFASELTKKERPDPNAQHDETEIFKTAW